uniref:Alternative protein MYOZ2 n=1 Tax=Homo sapiens TaxID=9606 RepID=L8E8B5_HUMAN|nr:alternative protein MYOZ2 [Homo sapiens]
MEMMLMAWTWAKRSASPETSCWKNYPISVTVVPGYLRCVKEDLTNTHLKISSINLEHK